MTSDSRTTAGTVRGDRVCHRVSATQEGLGGLSQGTAPPRPRLPAAYQGGAARNLVILTPFEQRSAGLAFGSSGSSLRPTPVGLALGS